MADLYAVSSSEDEMDQPPGTFKLIQDNETDEHGQRIVVLDPVPSSDPNEPLVGENLPYILPILD
jgi:hypothetical protein